MKNCYKLVLMALICLLTSLSAAANYSFTIRVDVDDVVTLDIDGREPVLLKAGDNTTKSRISLKSNVLYRLPGSSRKS